MLLFLYHLAGYLHVVACHAVNDCHERHVGTTMVQFNRYFLKTQLWL